MHRLKSAFLILNGKAIGVQFFEDLTPSEQTKYVKNKLI